MLMLEELERNTIGQSMPRVVTEAGTNRHFVVLNTLPAGIPDFEPFDRNYPRGQTETLTDSQITTRTTRVLNRLDSANAGYGPVAIQETATGPKRLTLFETKGLPVGYATAEPFMVSYAGGDRWHVNDGQFRWSEYALVNGESTVIVKGTIDVKGGDFDLQNGWLGFYVTVAPVANPQLGKVGYGDVQCSSIVAASTYTESRPTCTFPPPEVEGTPPENAQGIQWTGGRIFAPLAYVKSPSGGRPVILQLNAGVVSFAEASYPYPGGPTIL